MKDKSSLDLFDALSYDLVAGVDEAGRGALVGNVVAAAVILDPARPIAGLRDSKKLTEKQREKLALEIKEKALYWAVGQASAREIDEINILQAAMLAMKRAVEALGVEPDLVKVDGNHLPRWKYYAQAIVGGDNKVEAISAASIIAKTERDHQMKVLGERYPEYGFELHKGYGTPEHVQALLAHGITPEHRKTFSPAKDMLAGTYKPKKER